MSLKSDTLQSAWGAFFVAHALATNKIEKVLSEVAPLSMAEYDVMLTIERSAERRIRYSELASSTVYTRSGITRIVKRLEERGLIDRQKCESDKRGAFAVLNDSGAAALRDTWKIYSEEILKVLDPALSKEDATQLEAMMVRIIEQVSSAPLIQIGSATR